MSGADRVAAAFLWVLMALGSVAMWVAIPAGWLWVAGHITSDQAQHILLSVLGAPVAIIVWARLLFWINRLYLRITAPRVMAELAAMDEDDVEEPQFVRGPLEPLMVGSLVIALIAMTVWFFVFAQDPPAMLSGA